MDAQPARSQAQHTSTRPVATLLFDKGGPAGYPSLRTFRSVRAASASLRMS